MKKIDVKNLSKKQKKTIKYLASGSDSVVIFPVFTISLYCSVWWRKIYVYADWSGSKD